MEAEVVRVELELTAERREDGVVNVQGTARPADGPVRDFIGWMALLQLLETLVDGDR